MGSPAVPVNSLSLENTSYGTTPLSETNLHSHQVLLEKDCNLMNKNIIRDSCCCCCGYWWWWCCCCWYCCCFCFYFGFCHEIWTSVSRFMINLYKYLAGKKIRHTHISEISFNFFLCSSAKHFSCSLGKTKWCFFLLVMKTPCFVRTTAGVFHNQRKHIFAA